VKNRGLPLGLLAVTACAGLPPSPVARRGLPPSPVVIGDSSSRRRPPSTEEESDDQHAVRPPSAAGAGLVAQVAALNASGEVDVAACATLVGFEGQPESCVLMLSADHAAAIVQLVTGCGGDSCSTLWWFVSDGLGLVDLPTDDGAGGGLGGGATAFVPGAAAVLTDVVAPGEQLGSWTVRTTRVDAITGEIEPFADCMGIALGPAGRDYGCRNRRGDLFRLSLDGRTLSVVAKSGLDEAQVDWVPYAWIYPEAPRFAGGWATVETVRKDGAPNVTQRIRW
jgi:hypothetical protein